MKPALIDEIIKSLQAEMQKQKHDDEGQDALIIAFLGDLQERVLHLNQYFFSRADASDNEELRNITTHAQQLLMLFVDPKLITFFVHLQENIREKIAQVIYQYFFLSLMYGTSEGINRLEQRTELLQCINNLIQSFSEPTPGSVQDTKNAATKFFLRTAQEAIKAHPEISDELERISATVDEVVEKKKPAGSILLLLTKMKERLLEKGAAWYPNVIDIYTHTSCLIYNRNDALRNENFEYFTGSLSRALQSKFWEERCMAVICIFNVVMSEDSALQTYLSKQQRKESLLTDCTENSSSLIRFCGFKTNKKNELYLELDNNPILYAQAFKILHALSDENKDLEAYKTKWPPLHRVKYGRKEISTQPDMWNFFSSLERARRPNTLEKFRGALKKKLKEHFEKSYLEIQGLVSTTQNNSMPTYNINSIYTPLEGVIEQSYTRERTSQKNINLNAILDLTTNDSNKVIIKGDGGAGKTTFMLKSILDWLGQDHRTDAKFQWIFYISLPNLRDMGGINNAFDLIKRECFLEAEEWEKDLLEKTIRNDLSQNKVWLVLDGFDECYSEITKNTNISKVFKELLDFQNIILISRQFKYYHVNKPGGIDFKSDISVELKGFATDSYSEYIKRFCTIVLHDQQLATREAVQQKILDFFTRGDNAELCTHPIYCELICLMFCNNPDAFQNNDLRATLSFIFTRAFFAAAFRWYKKKSNPTDDLSAIDQKYLEEHYQRVIEFCEEVAYTQVSIETLANETYTERAMNILQIKFSPQDYENIIGIGILKVKNSDVNIDLEQSAHKEYEFVHRNFQLFFAARRIAAGFSKDKANHIKSWIRDNKFKHKLLWQFTAGILACHNEATGLQRFFQALFSKPRDFFSLYELCAFIRCLNEIVVYDASFSHDHTKNILEFLLIWHHLATRQDLDHVKKQFELANNLRIWMERVEKGCLTNSNTNTGSSSSSNPRSSLSSATSTQSASSPHNKTLFFLIEELRTNCGPTKIDELFHLLSSGAKRIYFNVKNELTIYESGTEDPTRFAFTLPQRLNLERAVADYITVQLKPTGHNGTLPFLDDIYGNHVPQVAFIISQTQSPITHGWVRSIAKDINKNIFNITKDGNSIKVEMISEEFSKLSSSHQAACWDYLEKYVQEQNKATSKFEAEIRRKSDIKPTIILETKNLADIDSLGAETKNLTDALQAIINNPAPIVPPAPREFPCLIL